MTDGSGLQMGSLPKPGPALKGALYVLFGGWLVFALAINWGGASNQLFFSLCGNTEAVLSGQVWRLFTAAFMHDPTQLGQIFFACLALYFLTPSLEQQWGTARTVRFFIGSALIAYSVQLVCALVLPASIAARLVPTYWYGSFPIAEAISIAWACSFRGQTIRLYFVLPVTSRGLILFVIGFSVLRVIATSMPPEGLLAPFGGIFAGWLLGGGTPSPLRKIYLRARLAQLDREAQRADGQRKRRVKQSSLRVIKGGRGGPAGNNGHDEDSSPGSGGKWLN